MNTWKITVKDDFLKKEYTGEFTAKTEQDAIEQAKEYYAEELDTFPEDVQIVDVALMLFVSKKEVE